MDGSAGVSSPAGGVGWKLLTTVAAVAAAAVGTGIAAARTGAVDMVAEPRVTATFDAVPYSSCPDEAPLDDLHRGDRVYLTGRSANGRWVEVRAPFDTDQRVWVETEWIVADASVDELPVTACAAAPDSTTDPRDDASTSTSDAPPSTVPASDPADVPVSTSVPPTPTTPPSTSPTTAATTTTSTTTPDTTGPAIDLLAAEPTDIWEDANYGGCPTQPHVAGVSVMVADPSGVAAVWLRYDTGSGAVTVAMMPDGPDGYTATVGPFGDGEVTANRPIELVVTATDGRGNPSTLGSATALTLHNCAIG